jgi:hypothetical protein
MQLAQGVAILIIMPPLRMAMGIVSRRENPLSPYHDSYPQYGVSDPRALQEADLAPLVG